MGETQRRRKNVILAFRAFTVYLGICDCKIRVLTQSRKAKRLASQTGEKCGKSHRRRCGGGPRAEDPCSAESSGLAGRWKALLAEGPEGLGRAKNDTLTSGKCMMEHGGRESLEMS